MPKQQLQQLQQQQHPHQPPKKKTKKENLSYLRAAKLRIMAVNQTASAFTAFNVFCHAHCPLQKTTTATTTTTSVLNYKKKPNF